MKTLRASLSVVCVVLGIVSIAEATSDSSVGASQGTLTVNNSGYIFRFSGPGFNVPLLTSDDFTGYSEFTIATLDQISKMPTLFYTVPFGEMVYNKHLYQWMGSILFTVGAFNYRFDQNGNLLVWGPAIPSGSVTPCDLQNCFSVTGPTIYFGGNWHYNATFFPLGFGNFYGLSNLTVTTTPEPSSFSMIASGLLIFFAITLWQHKRGATNHAAPR